MSCLQRCEDVVVSLFFPFFFCNTSSLLYLLVLLELIVAPFYFSFFVLMVWPDTGSKYQSPYDHDGEVRVRFCVRIVPDRSLIFALPPFRSLRTVRSLPTCKV